MTDMHIHASLNIMYKHRAAIDGLASLIYVAQDIAINFPVCTIMSTPLKFSLNHLTLNGF